MDRDALKVEKNNEQKNRGIKLQIIVNKLIKDVT